MNFHYLDQNLNFKQFSQHVVYLQQLNYQVRKKVVYEIKFGDIAFIQIYTICGIGTGIIILIGSF